MAEEIVRNRKKSQEIVRNCLRFASPAEAPWGLEAWRLGGWEACRLGGLEAWMLGGLEAWRLAAVLACSGSHRAASLEMSVKTEMKELIRTGRK